jgi:hypothetical protein
MLHALLSVLAATLWVRAARLLCVAGEKPLTQIAICIFSPLICLHIFITSLTQCILERREA